ncbi:MAG: outer membrane lipid asymmetry maintenance protein MlaD [Gammaproteobacteria bacterium]|nr:outer membrane lipid asymmetry maintenance protein MlaD [Gammaproteobacteria bacterium]
MRSNDSLNFVVGLFVLSGILAFLLLALKVSGLQDFSWQDESFVLKANFSNIGGLKPRSRVTMSGVNIGRVKNITLSTEPGNYDAIVEMSLNPSLANMLPVDSSASIRTAGLIGDNYIALTPGASDTNLHFGETIGDTNSALVLEDLISKYLFSKTEEN